jgi:hypothetical protein
VAQLCVNTLLATKVTLITDGISFGTLRVKSMRNSSDSIGNRTPDLPACNAVCQSQLTALPGALTTRLIARHNFRAFEILRFNSTLTSVSCSAQRSAVHISCTNKTQFKTRTGHPSAAARHTAPLRSHKNRQMRCNCTSDKRRKLCGRSVPVSRQCSHLPMHGLSL